MQFSYENYAGIKKRKHKLGFNTKREAAAWMQEYIRKEQSDLDMRFDTFVDSYLATVSPDLRQSTLMTKQHIIELHIQPYFQAMKVRDITALDIVNWQNEIKKKGFSDTYLRSVNAQLNAIFNHGVKFYHLSYNPCSAVKLMGKSRRNSKEIKIWTQEEMDEFLESFDEKNAAYYSFLLLYWSGIRLGELLALTLGDIDFDDKSLSITKSYQKIHGKEIITKPKTEGSIRTIFLPDFVIDEMQEYVNHLYGVTNKDRLFQISKGGLEKIIKKGAEKAGIEKIRVHDLRHSHASLLISNHVDIATISDRLGHDKIKTTLDTYAHMFDGNARGVADILDNIYMNDKEE